MKTHHVVLSMARSPSGEFLAGSHKGLFRWDQQDKQWRNELLTLPDQAVYAVAFDPSNNRQYARSNAAAPAQSAIASRHWQRFPEDMSMQEHGMLVSTDPATAVQDGGELTPFPLMLK